MLAEVPGVAALLDTSARIPFSVHIGNYATTCLRRFLSLAFRTAFHWTQSLPHPMPLFLSCSNKSFGSGLFFLTSFLCNIDPSQLTGKLPKHNFSILSTPTPLAISLYSILQHPWRLLCRCLGTFYGCSNLRGLPQWLPVLSLTWCNSGFGFVLFSINVFPPSNRQSLWKEALFDWVSIECGHVL